MSIVVIDKSLYTWGTTGAATTIGNWMITTASTNATVSPQYVTLSAGLGVRRPPPREFNRYVNASDLIEEFIAWVGTQGVRRGEVMALPLESFIKWLIIRACEEDQEEPNVELILPPRRRRPQCLGCGRFLARVVALPLCRAQCAERHFGRLSRTRRALTRKNSPPPNPVKG